MHRGTCVSEDTFARIASWHDPGQLRKKLKSRGSSGALAVSIDVRGDCLGTSSGAGWQSRSRAAVDANEEGHLQWPSFSVQMDQLLWEESPRSS